MHINSSVLLLIGLFSLSSHAGANYDPTKIRDGISEQNKIFKVKNWQQENNAWIASSEIRGLKISVNDKTTELILPFINFKQKRAAKQRCEALGHIGLKASSDIERQKIHKTIHEAARTHEIQTLDMNNSRLLVLPKLLGSYVRLHCKIKSNA